MCLQAHTRPHACITPTYQPDLPLPKPHFHHLLLMGFSVGVNTGLGMAGDTAPLGRPVLKP